jgi:hypothetical protein
LSFAIADLLIKEPVESPKLKRQRKAKTELGSRLFKDGAIYLVKRADCVKAT